METFLAVLLALGIYVVIPILIGLLVCTSAILYDRRRHKVEKIKAVEEAEKMVKETPAEKAEENITVG
ncbi:MAG: hypothetical protein JW762_11920 [Dehalococcoidales bacterium]|nr:hypothetical protein [Dehalococcoidales bacterium]